MERNYKTKHFHFRRVIDDPLEEFVEFSVLNSGSFDLVEESFNFGCGISRVRETGFDLEPYIGMLEGARTEEEMDNVLYDIYFIMGLTADYQC